MEVNNPDFIKSFPMAAVSINENEMIIFGGETTKTFIFDTRNVSDQGKANVVTSGGLLDNKSRFAFKTDYVCRKFGTIFYAIDSELQIIHTYELSGQDWYSQPISEFGFE